MAKNVEFELNIEGLRELMKSAEMQQAIQEATEIVADKANGMADEGNYNPWVSVGDYAAVGRVYTGDSKAEEDNYENNTLIKALGSSGLSMKK